MNYMQQSDGPVKGAVKAALRMFFFSPHMRCCICLKFAAFGLRFSLLGCWLVVDCYIT